MSLVGHPAHDLPPKAIVISVLDALAPAPRGIGAHVEYLAIAGVARDEQRDAPVLVARSFVDSEHFRAGPRLDYRGVPIKPRQPTPHSLVGGGIGREHGEPVVAPAESQLEPGFRAAGEAGALREISVDGNEFGQRGISKG